MSKFLCIISLIFIEACSTLTPGEKGGRYGDTVVTAVMTKAGQPNLLDKPVVIAPEVEEGFRFLYRFITEVEFVLCLEGKEKGGRITVTGFRLARLEVATVNSVRYQPCLSDEYVGTAHNHPPTNEGKSLCYQSESDRRSFGIDPRAKVDVVLCGDDKYYWVLKTGHSGAERIIIQVKEPEDTAK
jgi:hypothetical protein